MCGYLQWWIGNVLLQPLKRVLVEYHMEWRNGAEQPIYGWLNTGCRAYQAQWLAMRLTTDGKAIVEAGLDTIHQCADAMWFE